MNRIGCFFIFLFLPLFSNAQQGSITELKVIPRQDGSGLIDIHFDLSGTAPAYNMLLEVSFDGGDTYAPVTAAYISGDVAEVSPGQGKHIVWEGLGSFPNTYSPHTKIKITATTQGSTNGDWPRDTQTQVVDVTNPVTGKTWMDRNLGASRAATSRTDSEAYGDLYQWGRAADGHQKRNSATTSTLSSSDTPGHGDFILAPNSPHDWRSPQNTNLWQGVNGVNNPCPPGYRLPTEAELNAERGSWSSNNSAGAFASPLKLTVAGSRSRGSGSLSRVGSYGRYWSSTTTGISSRYIVFHTNYVGRYERHRANGHSVRCLKDQ